MYISKKKCIIDFIICYTNLVVWGKCANFAKNL